MFFPPQILMYYFVTQISKSFTKSINYIEASQTGNNAVLFLIQFKKVGNETARCLNNFL